MAKLDAFALGGVKGRHHLPPENARMHDIRLFDRGQLDAALARKIHPDTTDPLDLGRGIGVGVIALAGAVSQIVDAARLGEIGTAAQLAKDHDIEAGDHIRLQR